MTKPVIKALRFTPSFRGKHNETRSKVWLILLERQLSGLPGLTLSELSLKIKCSGYKSLSTLISRWTKRRYIGYTSRPGGRQYHLLRRGERWLDRWIQAGILPLDRYLRELEER